MTSMPLLPLPNSLPPLLCPAACLPACLQDITGCESEATKKGVQVGATQKALDKLGKEAAKAEAEREKMTLQQQESMQVCGEGSAGGGCGSWADAGAAAAGALPLLHPTPTNCPLCHPPRPTWPGLACLNPPACRSSICWRRRPSRCWRLWRAPRPSWLPRRWSWGPSAPSLSRRRRRWVGGGGWAGTGLEAEGQ